MVRRLRRWREVRWISIGLGPFAYVLAAERGVAEALVTTAVDGRLRTYRSALIVHRHSGLGSLEDLARAAPRLTLNFTDPASNSGYLVPRARLLEQALHPERSFKRVTYTLSHSVSVLNVVHGRADVAGVNASTLERLLARGRVAPGELVTLWESPALPSGPVVIRKKLPESLKRELQAALVALPSADPAAWQLVEAQFADAGTRYVACDDGLYEGLRALGRRRRGRVRARDLRSGPTGTSRPRPESAVRLSRRPPVPPGPPSWSFKRPSTQTDETNACDSRRWKAARSAFIPTSMRPRSFHRGCGPDGTSTRFTASGHGHPPLHHERHRAEQGGEVVVAAQGVDQPLGEGDGCGQVPAVGSAAKVVRGTHADGEPHFPGLSCRLDRGGHLGQSGAHLRRFDDVLDGGVIVTADADPARRIRRGSSRGY
jgi:hypothetical protein